MRPRTLLLLVYFTFAVYPEFAHSIPESAWQKALLKDIQLEQRSSVTGALYEGNGSLHGGSYTVRHFFIETPEMIYEVTPVKTRTLVRLNKGKLDFVVNSSVQYTIEKTNMFLRDGNGQVGEFKIEKKTLKQPQ
jgi:hypothetical protein